MQKGTEVDKEMWAEGFNILECNAFDSNGAQFDADGQLRDWWTAEDKEEFQSRITKMDNYFPWPKARGFSYLISSLLKELNRDPYFCFSESRQPI